MKSFSRKQKLAAFILSLALPFSHLAVANAAPAKPKQPVPLSAFELSEIYKDKTWNWGTGGGRFSDKDRRFVAFTDDKGLQSFGEGTWSVDNTGKLCMRATWTNRKGKAPANTCFGHHKVGNTIYQRRQPNGGWYVFRHAPARAGDEFLKLAPADGVTAKALALKQVLTATK